MTQPPRTQPRSADKAPLSPSRRDKPYRETPDVADAVCRLIRSIGKRLATEDPEQLAHLIAMDAALKTAWTTAIAGIRSSGATDSDIGAELGVTKQAVAQRFPR